MISLKSILQEATGKPKAVIMAGGAGTGKSYLLDKLQLHSLVNHNPDKYVEDKEHPYYGNLGPASRQVSKDVDVSISKKESFVWDTTAANPKNVQKVVDAGYDVYMVMVYAHPIISFMQNAKRERKVPRVSVFRTWRDVYNLVGEYYKMLDGNVAMFINDYGGKFDKYIEGFNTAAQNGSQGVADYLQRLADEEGIGKGGSTFFKPVELSDEEQQEFEKDVATVDYDRDNRSVDKAVKQAWKKSYDKIGAGPGADKLKQAVEKKEAEQEKGRVQEKEIFDAIADMLYSEKFQALLQHSSPKDIDSKIQTFLS
jgi:predicted kinase